MKVEVIRTLSEPPAWKVVSDGRILRIASSKEEAMRFAVSCLTGHQRADQVVIADDESGELVTHITADDAIAQPSSDAAQVPA